MGGIVSWIARILSPGATSLVDLHGATCAVCLCRDAASSSSDDSLKRWVSLSLCAASRWKPPRARAYTDGGQAFRRPPPGAE